MRTSPRELLLQNLLATSATLVFRATKVLAVGNRAEQLLLVIECEQWFSEAKASLSRGILLADHAEDTDTSAPVAENSGENWKRVPPEPGVTLSPQDPVTSTEIPSPGEVPSSPDSSGEITPEPTPSKKPSTDSPLNFFFMK